MRRAILSAFEYDSLKRALAYGGFSLEQITLAQDLKTVVADVVQYFEFEGKVPELIECLQNESSNPQILSLSWKDVAVENVSMDTSQEIKQFRDNLSYIRSIVLGLDGVKGSGLVQRMEALEGQVDHVVEVLETNKLLQARQQREDLLRKLLIAVSIICVLSLGYGLWVS